MKTLGFVVAALLGAAGIAAAEEPGSGSGAELDVGYAGDAEVSRKAPLAVDDCRPNDPSLTHDQLIAQGGEHYERGEQLYLQGDYKGAVQELVSSYCTIPYYSILKDIGQAYERDLNYDLAIAYMRRYYTAVPDNAQRASACAPDPQVDKRNIESRIVVLEDLRASVLIDTNVQEPDKAHVVLESDGREAGRGEGGESISVLGNKKYTVLITAPGYEPVTQVITPAIGKPATRYVKMTRQQGKLRVRAPGDARIYLDDRFLGVGAVVLPLDAHSYALRVEEPDHTDYADSITILAHQELAKTVELEELPRRGRRQLMVYATIAGAAVGGTFGQVINNQSGGLGFLVGAGAGIGGVYYFGDRNVPLGTSSLTITSSIIGAVAGFDASLLFHINNNDDQAAFGARIGSTGLVLGAVTGYYLGDQTKVSVGDAALVNSGALWGGVAGHLFGAVFQGGQTLTGGLGLSGLAMGTTGGILLARYYAVSRKHAALIDLGGLVGIITGVAADNLIFNQTTNATGTASAASQERTADFAIGGLVSGLVIAGVLTRTMDLPNVGTAAVGHATGADGKAVMTVGIGGSF